MLSTYDEIHNEIIKRSWSIQLTHRICLRGITASEALDATLTLRLQVVAIFVFNAHAATEPRRQ